MITMDIANTEKVSNTLERIEKELDMLGLWKMQRPNISKFDSETPFCMDLMNFHEWLQFVLIERFREMIKDNQQRPTGCKIFPYAAELYRNQLGQYKGLLQALYDFDKLFNDN